MLTTSTVLASGGSAPPELLDFDDLELRQAFEAALEAASCRGSFESSRPNKRVRPSFSEEEPSIVLPRGDIHNQMMLVLQATVNDHSDLLMSLVCVSRPAANAYILIGHIARNFHHYRNRFSVY